MLLKGVFIVKLIKGRKWGCPKISKDNLQIIYSMKVRLSEISRGQALGYNDVFVGFLMRSVE